MSKIFTLQEAESMIPQLEGWLREVIDSKKQVVELDSEFQEIQVRIQMMGGSDINPAGIAEKKMLRNRNVERLNSLVDNIQQTGCLVKDLDMGLIDFPALKGAEEVYLCWKMGESRIDFWHGVAEGFSGRKRISDEFGNSEGPLRPN
jgi:hypothetical protein